MAAAVEVIEHIYACWNAGEYAALSERVDPGVELIQDATLPTAPVLHGLDGWRHWMDRWAQAFPCLRFTADAIVPLSPECVLALVSVTARASGSDTPRTWAAAHLWTVRDGLVVRWQPHLDLDAARHTLDDGAVRSARPRQPE
ncbi:MAG: nuclear transport factor 2 family protein [Actinomycetota bacterium]|nr:nuclear transport factor 2 family protein [Actinomycetota bacterium]